MGIIHDIRHYFERHGFDVITRLSERIGIGVKSLRLLFIYASFLTLGVSFAVYLFMAFVLKVKDLIYTKRTSVFDL